MSSKLDRLKALADELTSYEVERKRNFKRLKELFNTLELEKKCGEFNDIFDYKAINLSAISLSKESLGKISEGKYAQIIGIKYIEDGGKSRAKNINLRYFGRVEKLDKSLKYLIIEFVLRWRLEKNFHGVDHYKGLIKAIAAN